MRIDAHGGRAAARQAVRVLPQQPGTVADAEHPRLADVHVHAAGAEREEVEVVRRPVADAVVLDGSEGPRALFRDPHRDAALAELADLGFDVRGAPPTRNMGS